MKDRRKTLPSMFLFWAGAALLPAVALILSRSGPPKRQEQQTPVSADTSSAGRLASVTTNVNITGVRPIPRSNSDDISADERFSSRGSTLQRESRIESHVTPPRH